MALSSIPPLKTGASSAVPAPVGTQKLDCTLATQQVWLVKVPKYLAASWESSEEETMGEVKITRHGPLDKLEIKLRIKDSLKVSDVSEYDINLTPFSCMKMAVIAENPETTGLIMDGSITRRADIRPSDAGSVQYMEFKKAQIRSALVPTRIAKAAPNVVNNYKPVSDHGKRKAAEVSDSGRKVEKKLREDRDVVLEKLFQAFEKHQYFNIKDLVDITNQPVGYLKDLLKEFCEYNVKNPHKNMWELKPEYRHYSG